MMGMKSNGRSYHVFNPTSNLYNRSLLLNLDDISDSHIRGIKWAHRLRL